MCQCAVCVSVDCVCQCGLCVCVDYGVSVCTVICVSVDCVHLNCDVCQCGLCVCVSMDCVHLDCVCVSMDSVCVYVGMETVVCVPTVYELPGGVGPAVWGWHGRPSWQLFRGTVCGLPWG